MLQMRNADDGKSGWNANETHLIIPMIDGDLMSNSEKILTNTIALNSLEGGHQTILTNGLDHSFVVGLDRNMFEPTNYRSDLLIIQNPDLRLLPCNTDLRVAYTLSNVEQDRSEILWQNPSLKDTRICTNDKPIFEVRQVLNYGDVDLERNNSQINVESVDSDMSQVTKPEKEISVEETNKEKSPEPQFVVNYNQTGDNDKSVSVSQNNKSKKSIENTKSMKKKKLHKNDKPSKSNVNPSCSDDFEETVYSATNRVSCGDSWGDKKKSDILEKAMKKEKETSDECKEIADKWNEEMSDFFPEKNLPLKKKAKMKRTLTETAENGRSLLNQDVSVAQQCLEFQTRKKMKQSQTGNREGNSNPQIVKNKTKKQSKIKIKIKSTQLNSPVKELMNDNKRPDTDEMTVTKFKSIDETTFSDIFHLVNYLRKIQIINFTIWQILNSGLKEIKVDILKEMITKRKENCSLENCNYSPQLKAFALVLYFKQPAAFNYLSRMFKNGWPTLKIIKEWKRRMNTIRRRNFIREQSETENDNSLL